MATHSSILAWRIPWTEEPGKLLPMEFSRQEYWSGLPFSSPKDLPDPETKLGSPALQPDSLPSEPPRKPKNTGEGRLSLLQDSFPTQELNQGLLHCSQILYQLSYQGTDMHLKELRCRHNLGSVQFSSVAQSCPTL